MFSITIVTFKNIVSGSGKKATNHYSILTGQGINLRLAQFFVIPREEQKVAVLYLRGHSVSGLDYANTVGGSGTMFLKPFLRCVQFEIFPRRTGASVRRLNQWNPAEGVFFIVEYKTMFGNVLLPWRDIFTVQMLRYV
ncbi:hypothetical protein DQK91_19015 [Oceanidesulfovibrio marinus]|uniref:Uncharacterized protein n=1 Tax=Oceanidesulfovibrio marinus TaxID=370038 RepID=A0A6P1ZCX3_9BACT|nr:hypothetical protein DQK91_19015 [Oceanidesulfovibrio marinus]